MTAQHLELLVEERSMKAFLEVLLPRLLPAECTFHILEFEGKRDLIKKLPSRLQGYKWLPPNWRLVVMVDQDSEDCRKLKAQLEETAYNSGLITRTQAGSSLWQVVNLIVIEELEAWYFGDWKAVCTAYSKVNPNIPKKAGYRNPDGIQGTWESFERILQRHGYFKPRLNKTEAARAVAAHFDPDRNSSRSFTVFRDAVSEAAAGR